MQILPVLVTQIVLEEGLCTASHSNFSCPLHDDKEMMTYFAVDTIVPRLCCV